MVLGVCASGTSLYSSPHKTQKEQNIIIIIIVVMSYPVAVAEYVGTAPVESKQPVGTAARREGATAEVKVEEVPRPPSFSKSSWQRGGGGGGGYCSRHGRYRSNHHHRHHHHYDGYYRHGSYSYYNYHHHRRGCSKSHQRGRVVAGTAGGAIVGGLFLGPLGAIAGGVTGNVIANSTNYKRERISRRHSNDQKPVVVQGVAVP